MEFWNLKGFHAWMDGGTITLEFENPSGEKFEIEFVQHILLEYYEGLQKIPGRLYLNNQLIERRSDTEKETMGFLKSHIMNKLSLVEKKFLTENINFVESAECLNFKPTHH